MEIWVEQVPKYDFSKGSIVPQKYILYRITIFNHNTSEYTFEEYTDILEITDRIIKEPFNGKLFPMDMLDVREFIKLGYSVTLI